VDGDTHDALRKAGTHVLLHIPVSRVRLAEFTGGVESLDERSGALKSSVLTTCILACWSVRRTKRFSRSSASTAI